MTLFEYVEEAIKTESAVNPLNDDAVKRGANPRILHGLIGIETEISEAIDAHLLGDNMNLQEEIYDMAWYCAIIIDAMSNDTGDDRIEIISAIDSQMKDTEIIHEGDDDIVNTSFDIIATATGNALDYYKKIMFYGKDMTKTQEMRDDLIHTLFQAVFETLIGVREISKMIGVPMSKGFEANIAKLKTRYSDKFSSRDAEERDTKKEYEEMRKILKK